MIVGIIGGGQLARMLALAGYPLGLRFLVLDPAPDATAGQVAELLVGDYDDPARLEALAERCDVVTFDFENVPEAAARQLATRVPVYPPPQALAAAQDRLTEKGLFQDLGIPTPPHAAIDSLAGLEAAVAALGLPAVLKTRRMGYDGKGQRVLRSADDIGPAWEALGGVPLILEGFVPFQCEVSILAARGRDGALMFYPLVENRHQNGILSVSVAPASVPELAQQAEAYARRVLERLDYVGLLAIEFFVRDGQLIANEMAPRVHNSGHWTIEGAETSQFENHLRAVCGLPLGEGRLREPCAMLNFVGAMPAAAEFLSVPGSHYHDYGKLPRAGRKVGHGTVCAADLETLRARVARLLPLIGG